MGTHVGTANEVMYRIAYKLISYGAKKDFHSACALGSHAVISDFFSKDPSIITRPGPDGAPPLSWAARRGQDDVISWLLEKHANINQINEQTGLMPLEEAIMFHGTIQTMALLFNHGATLKKRYYFKASRLIKRF